MCRAAIPGLCQVLCTLIPWWDGCAQPQSSAGSPAWPRGSFPQSWGGLSWGMSSDTGGLFWGWRWGVEGCPRVLVGH